jgi:hypothetical protein
MHFFSFYSQEKKLQQLAIAASCLTGPCERSRLLVTGGGRAGKTSLCRSLQNLDFQHTASTVGIDSTMLEVSIDHMVVGRGETGGDADADADAGSGWAKHTPPEKETEFALAKQVMKEQRRRERQKKDKNGAGNIASDCSLPSAQVTHSRNNAVSGGSSNSNSSSSSGLSLGVNQSNMSSGASLAYQGLSNNSFYPVHNIIL